MTENVKHVDVLQKVIHWAESRCPCKEETPDPCTLCGATVAEGTCKAVESIFPRELLRDLRDALQREAAGGGEGVAVAETYLHEYYETRPGMVGEKTRLEVRWLDKSIQPGTKLYTAPHPTGTERVEPAPNWCRTCGKLWKDATARLFCRDEIHGSAAINPTETYSRSIDTTPASAEPGGAIDAMVNRFLCWKFPNDFAPDGGISFKHITDPAWTHDNWPIGTNLLTAPQARAMLEHVIGPVLHEEYQRGYEDGLRDNPEARGGGEAVDRNVEAVRTKLQERSHKGISEYGVNTERADYSPRDWLRELQTELLDGAVYVEAAMNACTCPSGDGSLRWPCPMHTHHPTPAALDADGGLAAEVVDAALGVATIHVDQSYFGPNMIGPGKKIRIFVTDAARATTGASE